LQALLDAVAAGELAITIAAVGADREASGLVRARSAGIDTFILPYNKGDDRSAWDHRLTELVGGFEPDLVISAGFMKLVGAEFLDRFGGRFINTHPSLLPNFPGAHAVRDTLAAGATMTGCTVFAVDAGVDTGPVIAQEAVPVLPGDDEATLHERIKKVERRLLVEVVRNWKDDHE